MRGADSKAVTQCLVFSWVNLLSPGVTQSNAQSLVLAAVPGVEDAILGTIIHPCVLCRVHTRHWPAGNTSDWCRTAQVSLGKAEYCSHNASPPCPREWHVEKSFKSHQSSSPGPPSPSEPSSCPLTLNAGSTCLPCWVAAWPHHCPTPPSSQYENNTV